MEDSTVSIQRRLGTTPKCSSEIGCPDIFELGDGRFAVIGTDMTDLLERILPPGAGRSAGERIVVIDRETLVGARSDIPTA